MSLKVTNIGEFTNYWRSTYPSLYEKKSDEEIFEAVRKRYPKLQVPSYDEALTTQIQEPTKTQEDSLINTNTNPEEINSFWMADLVPEDWKDEGFAGISKEFFRDSYNKSMAGMLFKTINGYDKWEVDPGYDPGFLVGVGQFAVGMLSPTDAAVMAATGTLGKVASVGARATVFGRGAGAKYLEKGILSNFASKNATTGAFMSNVIDGSLSMGIGGAGFSAAHAMVAETAKQRAETGKVNIRDAMRAASDEFMHAAPMFAVTGGVTQGIMGSLYGYSNAYMKKGSYAQKITKAATNPYARVGAEGAMFTSMPAVFGDEDAPKLGTKEWWSALGANTLLVGGMRAVGSLAESKHMDALNFVKTEMKLENASKKQQYKAHKALNENLGQAAPKETKDFIRNYIKEEAQLKIDLKKVDADFEFIQKINKKMQDESYLAKIGEKGSKESLEFAKYSELVNEYNVGLKGMTDSVLSNEAKIREHWKAENGVEPTPTELIKIQKNIENFSNELFKNKEWVDDYLAGNWRQSKDGIKGGEPTAPTIEPLRTRIGGKTREQAKKFSDERLIKEAKRLGIEYELTPKKKLKNKEQVIEDIYNQEKAIFQKEEALAKARGETTAETIVGKIKGGVTYPKIENIVLKENLLNKGVKGSKELSGISDVNRNILTYVLDRLPEKRSHTRAAKEINKFTQYIEKKYKRNINELTPDELINLGKEYIQDRVGVKVYDKTNIQLSKEKYSDAQIRKFKRDADYIRDSLGELFTFGQLDKIVGDNIIGKIPKFNPRSVEKITLQSGEKGFNKWINYVKTKADKVIEFIGEKRGKPSKNNPEGRILKGGEAKTISKEGAELAIRTARLGKTRPTEIANLKVKHIDANTGEIRYFRSKQKGGGQRVDTFTDKKLAKQLINYAKKNKKGVEDRVFPFESAKEFNAFTKWLSDNSGTKVQLRIEGVPAPMGKGREYGRVFKTRFKGDEVVGDTAISKKQYLTEGTKEKRAERLLEEQVFQTKGDKASRDRFIAKVMKKNKLSKEQLKREGLNEGVLGEFGEGVIKLQEKVWQPADFYHENLHRLKAFARASNNKGLEKLIARGEKLAINTKEYKAWKSKNKGRDVEEFLADIVGGKASRMEFSKGLLNKVNQFVKQLVSRVKVAFGAGNFKDISRVLSKRVQKGFSTEGIAFAKGQVKYRMDIEAMSPESAVKFARKQVNEIFKADEVTQGQKQRVVKQIGKLGGLGDEFKLKEASMPELQQFVATLNSMDKNYIRRLPDKLEWFESFTNAETLRLTKNITEKQRQSFLKDLEVPDGSIYKASNRQLKDFVEIMNTMDDVKNSTISWIDERVARGKLNKNVAKRFKNLSTLKAGIPVAAVLESVGLNKLAQKMYSHTSQELKHIGRFSSFENNMQSLYGRQWAKVKEMITLFDKDRYFELKELGKLKSSEIRFIENTFDTKTWKPLNKGKNGQLVKEYQKLMRYYKNELIGNDGILKKILNDAEYEKFMKDKNINWINEDANVYVQRRITEEFKKYYQPNEKHFKELVDSQTKAISIKMAKEYYKGKGKKNVKQEKLEKKAAEFFDDANTLAHGELYEMFEFNPGKYSPSFLKKRHVKLPEFVKLDGKNVQVYERKFGLTVKDYSINQAKFLANIEYFPEFVRMKGFNRPGAKALLGELRIKDAGLARWVDRRLKDHLKIDKKLGEYPDGIRILRYSTSLAAKFQLSFPTSGLKNFVMGSTQSLLAFRLRDFFGGFADAIHRDNRAMVKATGATEIGMRHFEMKGLKGIGDAIAEKGFFKWGLMKPSENLNRYVSVLAGKRDQAHLARRIQNLPESSSAFKGAVNKLKTFYKLSDGEITLLKKFGLNGTKGFDAKTVGMNKRAVENLYQKMNTYAHVNTQGAAINLFMPDWAGSELFQSALLYKRMAYAATVNTTRNLKIALQNKSMLQPIMFGVGTYWSGEALIYLYDKLLGQSMPKENSNEWQTFKTIMWKGEFMGILSEFMSPWGDNYVGSTLYPSLLSTATLMYDSAGAVISGDKFAGQGFKEIGKGVAGLYNNTSKLYKQGLLSKDSYASQSKRYRKLYYDMLEEYNDRDEIEGQSQIDFDFERNKYMQSFWETFESGSKKDLGKWYMMSLFAKANDYYYAGIDEDGFAVTSQKDAMKKAAKSMRTSVTKINPNKARVTAKTRKAKAQQRKKAMQFLKWLDRNENLSKGLVKLENQYGARVRMLEKSMIDYIKSANLKKDLDYYGISIGDLIFK
tara:strand:- start:618 stop:7331 length:6714 start_codon:yes stop_codon:yes gene_type:complete